MFLSKLLFQSSKEVPKEATLPSHIYLLRGSFIKQVSSGVYTLLPLGMKVLQNIQKQARRHMEAVGMQEVLLPCATPIELWQQGKRYANIKNILWETTDKTGKQWVLCPTHEEPAVHAVQNIMRSYKQLPLAIFQIQTKFRDETRPRGGMIRLKEFCMKDGYSFHSTFQDFEEYYNQVFQAYMDFYASIGLSGVLAAKSDNGIFGGAYSHEFQLLSPHGEDKLFVCESCKYTANREVATTQEFDTHANNVSYAVNAMHMTLVETPKGSVEAVSKHLGVPQDTILKTMVFETLEQECIVVFIRGDLEINQAKLEALLKTPLTTTVSNTVWCTGFIGPINLPIQPQKIFVDVSVDMQKPWVWGANQWKFHYTQGMWDTNVLPQWAQQHIAWERVDVHMVKAGFACPVCATSLVEKNGIEVGNIFHLGEKYTENLGCKVSLPTQETIHPTMGCYGIGISRLLGGIIEEHHDAYGPIFPATVAPYLVHICVFDWDKNGEIALGIYTVLQQNGISVVLDDRQEKPGVQLNDADLIGCPIRLVVSSKNIENNQIEYQWRSNPKDKIYLELHTDSIVQYIKNNLSGI
jgi:prolyl-tRNA synthetase